MSDLKTFAVFVAECLIDVSMVFFFFQKLPGTTKSSSEDGIVTCLRQYMSKQKCKKKDQTAWLHMRMRNLPNHSFCKIHFHICCSSTVC